MQRFQPMLILLLALICGGAAAYMASGWLKQRSLQAQKPVSASETTPVVVAAKNIVAGSVLGKDLLKVTDWPKNYPVAGAISDPRSLENRVVRQPMVAGEIVLESKLAPVGTLGGMAGLIENDRRAITVKVDEASGVAGFIMPGNRVDVLLTVNQSEFKSDPMAKIVLQNLLVLGVGQDLESQKSGEKPKVVPTVTLEVSPVEGERLALAAKEGYITLALRGWTENGKVPTTGIRVSSLVRSDVLEEKKPEPVFETPIAAISNPPKKPNVEVLRGVEKEVVNF
jgi:pilus assembly protein CpaB